MLKIETLKTMMLEEAKSQTTAQQLLKTLSVALILTVLAPFQAEAADLKPQTVEAWETYLHAAKARNQKSLTEGTSFLSIAAEPAAAAKLREGEIVVTPAMPKVPLKVPSGLIHDWVGAIFIPNATIDDVMRVVRDYDHYQSVYRPYVVSSKPIESGESEDRFSIVIMNKSFFAKSALDSDYRSNFVRIDSERLYNTSETTRVQEVAEWGAASEHLLPENHGTGIIWKLYSFARYQERDGGVYIELEAIALSRDVPAALRMVVDPVVRRVSKSSLVTSLQQTADAVKVSASIRTTRNAQSPQSQRAAVANPKAVVSRTVSPSSR